MRLGKAAKIGGEELAAEPLGHADPQGAAEAGFRRHLLVDRTRGLRHRLGLRQQFVTRFGQHLAGPRAFEQGRLQALFQPFDPPPQRGGIELEILRRQPDLAGLGHGQENPDIVPVHILHFCSIYLQY